ncbi:MAG: ATP-binding protein, partial [Methanosarcinaceae archaeon]
IVVASSNDDVGTDRSAHEIFLNGKKGYYASDMNSCEFTDNIVMNLAAPIRKNNEVIGVLVLNFDAGEEISKITTDRTGLGKTGEVYVVNKDGYMITPSRFLNDTFLKLDVDSENVNNCMLHVGTAHIDHEAISSFENYMGIEVLGTHALIEGMQWYLLVEMDRGEALKPLDKLTNMLLSILLGLCIFGIIGSFLLSRTLTGSIVRLHEGTNEVKKGNLDYKVGTDANDEIGDLARTFDEMTLDIKKSREGLEKKVKERTCELRESNRKLEEDIEERKKAVGAVRKANELKDLFSDIMRHDLLNPAGIVKGYTQIILDMENDSKKLSILQKIEKSNERLISLIEQTAKFAKLESVDEFEFVEEDMTSIFRTVVDNFKPQIENKDMTLEFKAKGACLAKVNPMIEEVFVNLLSNAIKYSPPKSKIIVDIIDAGDNWKATVTDFGEGVLDKHKKLLFDRFHRMNKVGVKGSGLGLAIVKRIVELHKGEVGVEDNPGGVGSVFWVTVKKV